MAMCKMASRFWISFHTAGSGAVTHGSKMLSISTSSSSIRTLFVHGRPTCIITAYVAHRVPSDDTPSSWRMVTAGGCRSSRR
jgi:hypothetical protein